MERRMSLKTILINSIRECDSETRESIRSVVNVMSKEHSVMSILDIILSGEDIRTMIADLFYRVLESHRDPLEDRKEVLNMIDEKTIQRILDGVTIFTLNTIEDYTVENLNSHIDSLCRIYLDYLNIRRMDSSEKEVVVKFDTIKKSPVLVYLILLCSYCVEINMTLAREESIE